MIYVVSGYFATFHNGHKEYIKSVIDRMNKDDKLIVIVANQLQFKLKYIDYCPPIWKICKPIQNFLQDFNDLNFEIIRAIDRDTTVKETLSSIVENNPNDSVIFCKDGGEYDKENLPEKDVKGNNKKKENASDILNIRKR